MTFEDSQLNIDGFNSSLYKNYELPDISSLLESDSLGESSSTSIGNTIETTPANTIGSGTISSNLELSEKTSFFGSIKTGSVITGSINMGNGINENGIISMNHTDGMGDSALQIDKTDWGYAQDGLIFGIDDAQHKPKFYISSGGNHLAFNGQDIETQGTLIASTIFKVAIYTVATLPISQTSVGYNPPTSV